VSRPTDEAIAADVGTTADVVRRIRERTEARWLTSDEAAAHLGISRDTLDAIVSTAPDLPGGPVDVGNGKKRTLRWDATSLDAWFRAFGEWRRRRGPRPAPSHAGPIRVARRAETTPTSTPTERPRGGRRGLLDQID
jgi:hypothetical protein